MSETDVVLLLGSAPDVVRCRDWPRQGVGRIVAINNAWRVREDWDHLVHPNDFPYDRRPGRLRPGQGVHGYREYVPAANAFGGMIFCGGTMVFCAAYWALHALRPRLLAILGCDMVYAGAGQSHFYGKGTPDPLRPDPTLQSLEAKSARLALLAARRGCAVVNLSDRPSSRLRLPRLDAGALPGWHAEMSGRLCGPLVSGQVGRTVEEVLRREAALGYDVPSGKYWKEVARFDEQALWRIDQCWLQAASGVAEAA